MKMEGMSLLFKSNAATVIYSPAGTKFKTSELEQAVGGPFYLWFLLMKKYL